MMRKAYNINVLYDKDIVFPFFKDFYGKFSLPIHIVDEHYVEYKANPEYEVKIHYMVSSGDDSTEYITETMQDVYEGIRVKSFILFQDEHLEYYITESRPDGEGTTKKSRIYFDETMDDLREGSRYHALNLMLIAKEMNDNTTLIDTMKEYAKKRETVKKLFKPL